MQLKQKKTISKKRKALYKLRNLYKTEKLFLNILKQWTQQDNILKLIFFNNEFKGC